VTLVTFCLLLALQAPPPAAPPDPKAVDEAIRKGIDYLRKEPAHALGHLGADPAPLLLLTFVRTGVPESDPFLQNLMARMRLQKFLRTGQPQLTYSVALVAMALEELDRVKYQHTIALCAQYLVDSQSRDGSWSYGNGTGFAQDFTFPEFSAPAPAVGGKTLAEDGKPKVERRIVIRRRGEGAAIVGDNSCSQYAALGLRACHDAGIVIPEDVVRLAAKCWHDRQFNGPGSEAKPSVTTGTPGGDVLTGRIAGWAYGACKEEASQSAAMTAGGVGSLVITDYLLKKDWKTDPDVEAGLKWLGRYFSDEVLRWKPGNSLYYYMYALERAALLSGTGRLGTHDWYAEGAKLLLETQRPDGSWAGSAVFSNLWCDTCFAILFLKRSTRPLVGGKDVATPARPEELPPFSTARAPGANAAPLEKAVSDLVEKCLPSVAAVKTELRAGAGFCVGADNLFVTPYGVISGCRAITLEIAEGEGTPATVEATVYAVDPRSGLALLKAGARAPIPGLELDVPSSILPEHLVAAVGPRLRGRTLEECVSPGAVRSLPLPPPDRGLLDTTVAVDAAYSGAPLLTRSGKVAGILVPKLAGSENAGLAIPAERIKALFDGRDGEFRVTGSLAEWETRQRLGSGNKPDPSRIISLDSAITRFLVDEENDRILALEPASNSLLQVSLSEHKVVRKVFTGSDPSAFLPVPGSPKQVWVAHRGGRNLVKVDLDTKGAVTETIPISFVPAVMVGIRKTLWCLGEDGGIHVLDPSEKRELGRFTSQLCTGIAYDAKRERLWTMAGQWLSDYDATKILPIQRELIRQNLSGKERQDLQAAQGKASRTVHPPPNSPLPAGAIRTIGYGMILDEKDGKLYLNLLATKVEKPDVALGTFKTNAPHSLASDPAVGDFLRKNPFVADLLALSPDGKWVASGTQLWNAATFTVLRELPIPSPLVAFSRDSRKLYYYDWVSRAISTMDVESK
jgi:hypothetical protein